MNPDPPSHLQDVIDSICELGCDRIREIIQSLESGNSVSEIVGLEHNEQRCVLIELKTIMSVYDKDQS